MTNKWQVHRAGILNYWYYDEAEFLLAGGRMMLRGSNGSGKSVTMQSLVTVLLDGVTRASRLDSFGSQSRKIEDYLLGEKELSDYEERTGYLFLEYKRENSGQYLSTGIGLHARRGGSRVEFWGFVLQDGLRVGHNFQLYKLGKDPETGEQAKLPLTRRELESAIGTHGRVVTSQRDYMAMVNQYVFGFQEIGKYEELMKLLIQLRSPKLSRDFKPTVVYEILEAALPTLTDEDLRPLSDTLENMEKSRIAIEQRQREKAAFDRLCKAYDAYNEAVLAERQQAAQNYRNVVQDLKFSIADKQEAMTQAKQEQMSAASRQQELQAEQEALSLERRNLEENEAFKTIERRAETETELQKQKMSYEKRSLKCQQQRKRELELTGSRSQQENMAGEFERQSAEFLSELEDLAKTADFQADAVLRQGIKLSSTDMSGHMKLWQQQSQDYSVSLRERRREITAFEQKRAQAAQQEQVLGEANRKLDTLRLEREKLWHIFEQTREELVQAFYEWLAASREIMPFSEEQSLKLSGLFRSLCEDSDSTNVRMVLDAVYSERQQEISGEIGRLKAQLQDLAEQLTAEMQELQRLKAEKEAEPELAPAYKEAREHLRELGVPFVPFYEAVEFREDIDEEAKERLESALIDAGVLQAVLLENNEAVRNLPEETYGSVLQAGEPVMFASSLLDYLEPAGGEYGISKERIAEVLGSIEVSEAGAATQGAGLFLDVSSGCFQLGVLSGQAAPREAALYIGRQAREAYRRQQIAEHEAHLAELQEERTNREAVLAHEQREQERLTDAYRDFPSDQEVQEAWQDIQAKDSFIEQQEREVKSLDARLKELMLALQESRKALQALCQGSGLALTSAAYEEAEQAMSDYRPLLARLENCVQGYRQAQDMMLRLQAELEELRAEMDESAAERTECEMNVQKLERLLEALDRQLKEMDAAGVETRIKEVVERLSVLPQERDEAVRRATAAKSREEQLAELLQSMEARLELYQELLAGWEQLLSSELARGFVKLKEPVEEALAMLVQDWQRKLESGANLGRIYKHVTQQYYNDQSVLSDYRIQLDSKQDLEKTQTAGHEEAWQKLGGEEQQRFQASWARMREQGERSSIQIETNGRRESPYEQRTWLINHIAEQQNLLSEQDKKIYKEIIMNNIGRAISDYIYAAEEWIRKMNGLMQRSETSSALKFHLEWRPLRGESDAELDAADLVELLHADPESLRAEDTERLAHHFQSRIDRARQEAEGTERDSEAFRLAVSELLDYRHWFRFKLFYDKGSQIKHREMTDKVFFSFSGGEKAMAMYVPLFSAAYSRYLDAAPDAPYLITLDEAFAGVDDQNMRDMFRLVEDLGFNYIMNSQAIYGDYDVVPELNIYELLRPLNANYVSLYGTHWNGKTRELLLSEEDMQEEQAKIDE